MHGETGELVDVAPARHQQDQMAGARQRDPIRQRLGDLLAQRPISVEFKLSPAAAHVASTGGLALQNAARQCYSLAGDAAQPTNEDGLAQRPNRCHLSEHNATNYVCACDRFGFVALVQQSLAGPSGFPALQGDPFQWPPSGAPMNDPLLGAGGNLLAMGADQHQQLSDPRAYDSSFVVNKPQQQQPLGLVAYSFVLIGVALLVLSLVGVLINVILRFTGRSRLSKKHQSFFESMRNGTTTGPLAADHNLMGSSPLVSGAATTQSGSIIGLATGASNGGPMGQLCSGSAPLGSSHYKTLGHQQLYSAHVGAHSAAPMIEAYASSSSSGAAASGALHWPSRLASWLFGRPLDWLAGLTSTGAPNGAPHASAKTDRMIQHRIVGGGATIGTLAYHKSQYQNGYTTSPGLHHHAHPQHQLAHHQTLARPYLTSSGNGSQSGVPLNPSSSSSYVSSSAYYEEIGSANLTKVNASQLSGMGHQQSGASNQLTSLDPFMKQHQQQRGHYLEHAQNQHEHHPHPLSAGQTAGFQQAHQQQTFHQWLTPSHTGGNTAPISLNAPNGSLGQHQPQQQMSLITKQHLHNDLSPLQSSSSSSAGSQHSNSAAAASLTNGAANGSNAATPRHFLFASPIAVNAYKQQQQFRGHHHDQLNR